jgi:hypothetical protein
MKQVKSIPFAFPPVPILEIRKIGGKIGGRTVANVMVGE